MAVTGDALAVDLSRLAVVGSVALPEIGYVYARLNGEVAGTDRTATPPKGPDDVLDAIAATVRSALEQSGQAELTAIGIGIGLLLTLALSTVLRELVDGVNPRDPAIYALGTAVLLSIALAATYVPARRASSIDPQAALRAE